MAKIVKTLTVSWQWSGDKYSLRGFNLAVTPAAKTPKEEVVAAAFVETKEIKQTYSYKMGNVTLDKDAQYKIWVQAVYENSDSDWVATGGATVSDDGSATIITKTDREIQDIVNMASDNILTRQEKISLRREWQEIVYEFLEIESTAVAQGIPSSNTVFSNFKSKGNALGTYLNGGTAWTISSNNKTSFPLWINDSNLGNNTSINGNTYRETFRVYYEAKVKILEEINKYKVNSVQVGGVNLLVGTATAKNTNVNVPTSYVTWDPYTTHNKQTLEQLGFKAGDKVTIGFDWSISKNGTNDYVYGNFRVEFKGIKSDGTDNQYLGVIKNPAGTFSSSNTKGRVEATVALDSATIKAHSLRFRIDNSVLNFKVSNLKMERGTKATGWSPALEEMENAYTVILTNEAQVIPTNSNRVPTSSTTYFTDIQVYKGTAQRNDYTIGAINNANGITVSKTSSRVNFAVSTNTALAADGGNFVIPITIDGKTFNKTFSWSCSKQGNTGATGASGVGISKITEYYAVSSSNTTEPTSWSTTVPAMTATNKYLWNYETITYSNNTAANTSKRVIGVYGDKGNTGATGATGATGNGISKIVNYYLATSSSSGVTTSTSGWTTSVQAVSASKKYLWNYEVVTYTNGSTSTTTPCIIGTYGDKGDKGDNAKNVSLTATSQVFKSTDGGKNFTPDSITIKAAYQNVSHSKWQHSLDGGKTWVDTGTNTNGVTIDGNGFTISKSSTLFTDKVTSIVVKDVTNNSSVYDTITITRLYDVTDLQIGGRNLAKNSIVVAHSSTLNKDGYVSSGTLINTITGGHQGFRFDSQSIYEPNQKYVLSFNIQKQSGTINRLGMGHNGKGLRNISVVCDGVAKGDFAAADTSVGTILNDGAVHKIEVYYTTPATIPADTGTSYTYIQLNKETGTSCSAKFTNFKLEKGNKATDWSPAVEDLENAYTIVLTNEAQVIPTNSSRVPTSSTTYYTDIVVYQGTTQRTNYTIGTVNSANGITVSKTSSRVNFAVSTGTAIAADGGSFTIPITIDGKTFNKTFSWSCSKQGNTGATGNAGQDAITIILSNENHTFPCESNGNIPTALSTTCVVTAYKGGTSITPTIGAITNPTGMTITKNGATLTIQANTGTSLADSGTVNIPITVDGKTFNKTFTWSKAKKGATGATGPQGAQGNKGDKGDTGQSAKYVIVNGEQVFKYTNNFSGTPTPATITLTATKFNTSESGKWQYKDSSGTWIDWLSGGSVVTATSVQVHPTSGILGNAKQMSIRYIIGSVYDEITIVKVSDGSQGPQGIQGTQGATGQNADSVGVISKNYDVVTGNGHSELYIRGKKVANSSVTGHTVFKINKTTLAVEQTTKYATYGNESACTEMANYLNGLSNCIVAIISSDACRVTDALRTAISKIGGSKTGTWGGSRYSHYVIGMPGLASGQGYEEYKTGASATLSCTVPVSLGVGILTNGAQGIQGNKGDKGDTGATGPQGSAGKDAYTVILTNESHTFPAENNGSIASDITVTTDVLSYKGASSITPTIGTLPTVNGLTLSKTNNRVTIVAKSGTALADSGSFNIPITVDGKSFTKTFSWAKSRKGNTGATGATGAGAKTADIIASSQVFKSTDGGLTFSPTTITMTPKLQNVSYSNWQYSTNGGSNWNGFSNSISGWSISGGVLTINKDCSLFTPAVTSVVFRLNTNDSSVYDTTTIVKLYDVVDLEIGGRNLARKGSVVKYNSNASATTVNDANFATDGSATISRTAVTNEGAMIDRYVIYDGGGSYTVSFKMRTTSGTVNSIHFYNGRGHKNSKVYIDGAYKGTMGQDLTFPNDTNYHKVEVRFEAVATDSSTANAQNTQHIIPQPMKGTASAYTIQILNLKIEKGNKATDWTPAPEDVKSHAEQSAQNAVNAQTQASIFNKLTNNGQTQGIYLENSKIYINGEYIKANSITADRITSGTFRGTNFVAGGSSSNGYVEVLDSSNKLIFKAQKGGVVSRKITFVNDVNSGFGSSAPIVTSIDQDGVSMNYSNGVSSDGFNTYYRKETKYAHDEISMTYSKRGENASTGGATYQREDWMYLTPQNIKFAINADEGSGTFSAGLFGGPSTGLGRGTGRGAQAGIEVGLHESLQIGTYLAEASDNTSYAQVFMEIDTDGMVLDRGVRLSNSTDGNRLKIQGRYGNVTIGPANSEWCHFNTDRAKFWFEKNVHVNGEIYAGSGYNQKVYHTGNLSVGNFVSGANGTGTTSLSNFNSAWKSGFYEGNGAANQPFSDWCWMIHAGHTANNSGGAYNYGMQIAGQNCTNNFAIRTVNNHGAGTWNTLYHTGNKPSWRDVGAIEAGNWRTNGGQDLLVHNKRALVGFTNGELHLGYGGDFSTIKCGNGYTVYHSGNVNPLPLAHENGYYGMKAWSGWNLTNDWIRTTGNGLIPSASGTGSGRSSLGTTGWRFSEVWSNIVNVTSLYNTTNSSGTFCWNNSNSDKYRFTTHSSNGGTAAPNLTTDQPTIKMYNGGGGLHLFPARDAAGGMVVARGNGWANYGDVTCSKVYAVSDARKKKNIAPLDTPGNEIAQLCLSNEETTGSVALDIIKKAKAYSYMHIYDDDSLNNSFGLMAQDLPVELTKQYVPKEVVTLPLEEDGEEDFTGTTMRTKKERNAHEEDIVVDVYGVASIAWEGVRVLLERIELLEKELQAIKGL